MTAATHNPLTRLTLARQFMIASLIILVIAALGLGWCCLLYTSVG